MKTIMNKYDKNQVKPITCGASRASVSYPSRGAINLSTPGRKNAINTVAAACIPPELPNISMVNPVNRAINNKIKLGISTGNSNINDT